MGARTPGLDDLSDEVGANTGRRPGDAGNDDGDWDDDWDEPNYLIRRVLTIGGGVAAIAVVAFVVFRVMSGGDDGGAADSVDADWNSVVVLTADEIRVVDPSNGDVVDTYDAVDDLLDAQSATVGSVLVTLNDVGRIVQTDLTDGSSTRGRAGGTDETLRLSGDNPAVGIVGPDGGGDVTLIDTVGRNTISAADVADLDDPLIFQRDVLVNASGSHAAMSDARSFQSVVVDIENETAALLAGQIVAIGDDVVVTAQRAGANTELEFYELDGTRAGSVDVATPMASMLTSDGAMLIVDEAGAIRRATADGDVSDIGTLSDPGDATATFTVESGVAAAGNTRLLVVTNTDVVLLDDDGSQLAFAAGQLTRTATRATRCATVGSARSTGASVLLDLDDGSVRTEIANGTPLTTSVDGCTVALITNTGPQLVVGDEVRPIDADAIIEIAPDGSEYVVRDGRDSELVSVDGDDNVEVSDEPSVIRFAQR